MRLRHARPDAPGMADNLGNGVERAAWGLCRIVNIDARRSGEN
jgi:hypothetical protein